MHEDVHFMSKKLSPHICPNFNYAST